MALGDNWYTRYPTIEDTPAYRIFNMRFRVRASGVWFIKEEKRKTFGSIVSDNPEQDYKDTLEETIGWLSIPEMAEIYANYGSIHLMNWARDMQVIYDLTCEHIADSAEYNTNHINGSDIPLNDLLLLDRFAGSVYKKARPFLRTAGNGDKLADFMSQFSIFSVNDILDLPEEHRPYLEEVDFGTQFESAL